MTWVRIEENAPEHPKLAALDAVAFRAWFDAICYCNRQLTDGVIPAAIAHKLAPKPAIIAQLVKQRLWEKLDDGYAIHDFLDYQPSKETVEQLRSKRRAAGQAGGLARARASAVANGLAKSNPVPGPDPQESASLGDLDRPVLLTRARARNGDVAD